MADETTPLPAGQGAAFNAWLRANNVRDLDHPDSHYDYRGAFLAGVGRGPGELGHFPDTFKQHGHPTFSEESQYSKGPGDGGSWRGETFIPAEKKNHMGDVYKDIDFERMLSDLGAALERNKQPPGSLPAEQPAQAQQPGIPTARFPDVQPGMQVQGAGQPAPMSPQDAQTSAQLDAAAPGAIAAAGANSVPQTGWRGRQLDDFGPAPQPMSQQDIQTLAELNGAAPSAIAFGGGMAPPPMPAPNPMAQQLQGVAQQPTAMSAPPTQYPNINPQDDGGLAGYAALRR